MTLMLRPFRLGMSLRPYRLGAAQDLMVDGSGGDYTPLGPPQITPMPYTPPGPVEIGPRPVALPVPCLSPGYVSPNGAVYSNMARPCNPNGTPYTVADTLPLVASVPTSDGQTPVSNPGAAPPPAATVILSPTSGPIPPPNTPIVAAPATNIFTSTSFGIPNWLLMAAGAALLFMGDKK
jgi:hypothetical protein